MVNLLDSKSQKLIFWLQSLIEIMRADQSPSWFLLIDAVNGKSAHIQVDDTSLVISANGGFQLKVVIQASIPAVNPDFYTKSQILKGIISGRYLLDRALNDGLIFAKGPLEGLLDMYHLVLNILAEGSTKQVYLRFWLDFEKSWSLDAEEEECWKLENQRAEYGIFINEPYSFLSDDHM